MSKLYEKIRNYYDSGLWNKVRVRNMVKKNIITTEEFEKIVGREFKNQGVV